MQEMKKSGFNSHVLHPKTINKQRKS